MKKIMITILALASTFFLGYTFKAYTTDTNQPQANKKVTGIGGIFFKCNNPKVLKEWYQQNLGLNTNDYGTVFEWYQGADSTQKGFTQWSPFNSKTKYFEPSTKDFMINYRVANLTQLVNDLQKEGVTILDTIATYSYGKFVHILDIEGNKIELWQPNDKVYEQFGYQIGATTTK
jgi:predicted enzyme related to lactoylglutathione lyase